MARQNSHDLAGDGDVKAVLPGGMPLTLPPRPSTMNRSWRSFMSMQRFQVMRRGVDVERVALLDGVVDHGGQQVVGGTDGVDVAGKVEVDVLHGHDLA